MCRNIRTLFNFEPPATELEIRDASHEAPVPIAALMTTAEPKNREVEAARARARSAARFDGHQA